jgi:hypothetical protein
VITNVLADHRGEEIVTHAYFEATFLETERTRVTFGIYDDLHVEVDGELKIAHKVITVQRTLELPAASGSTYVQVARRGIAPDRHLGA